ncbi:hypothetical protein CBS101457_004860 [Exobasidium rhododendri]|nr:hypothetical protein CBS101457_004860 [Exobasidium rhododendri]
MHINVTVSLPMNRHVETKADFLGERSKQRLRNAASSIYEGLEGGVYTAGVGVDRGGQHLVHAGRSLRKGKIGKAGQNIGLAAGKAVGGIAMAPVIAFVAGPGNALREAGMAAVDGSKYLHAKIHDKKKIDDPRLQRQNRLQYEQRLEEFKAKSNPSELFGSMASHNDVFEEIQCSETPCRKTNRRISPFHGDALDE